MKTPIQLIEDAVEAFILIGNATLGLNLKKQGKPSLFNPEGIVCGSCISLTADDLPELKLAMCLDERSCEVLANALYTKVIKQQPPAESDIADALGELLNITAGRMTRGMQTFALGEIVAMAAGKMARHLKTPGDKKIKIGFPEYLTIDDFFDYMGQGFYLPSQMISGLDLKVQVVLLVNLGHTFKKIS